MGMTRAELLAMGVAAALPATLAAAAKPAGAQTFSFDEAAFDTILATPARHRQCFASTTIDHAVVLEKMVSSMYAYEISLKQGPGAMHAVAVLYGGPSIVLAFDDALWNDVVAPTFDRFSSTYRSEFANPPVAGKGNPYLHRSSSVALVDDTSVEALVSRGAHFFVCNNALEGFSDEAASKLHVSSSAMHARLLAGLVPGSMAVPAGVMAINACQEAHFTYLQVSL